MPYCGRINSVANVDGKAPARGRRDVPWPFVTFSTALVVYLLTLSHDVGTWDIAEFQTVPHLFGVAHPTGYPLFTILGGLWSWIPIGSVATRMNLLSAVLFAATAGVLCALGIRLRLRGAIAAAGALCFAFSTGVWRNATHVEAQSLHLLLVALLLFSWVIAYEDPSPRHIASMCLVVGFGLVHHGLMILTAAWVLTLFAVSRWRAVARVATLRLAIPAMLLPLLMLLYLPLRDNSAPILNANPQRSWWHKVRGEGFRGTMGTFRSLDIWERAADNHVQLLSNWIGVVVLFLALAGIGVLGRRMPTVTCTVAGVGLLASYAQANSTDSNDRYLITLVLVVCLFAVAGADAVIVVFLTAIPVRRIALVTAALAIAFALLPVNGLRANYQSLDAHAIRRNERNGLAVLRALPTNCVLWSYWDLRTELFYLRYVERIRTDVTILDHRSSAFLGSSFAVSATSLYDGVTGSAQYRGRPVCFVPFPGERASSNTVVATALTRTDRPWGLSYRTPGEVFLLERRPSN